MLSVFQVRSFLLSEWEFESVLSVFQVRSFLLSEQEFESVVQQADDKLELYENLLMDCKDAVNVVKEELRQDPVSPVTSRSAAGRSVGRRRLSNQSLVRRGSM